MNKRQLKKMKLKNHVKLISVIDENDILIFEFERYRIPMDDMQKYINYLEGCISNKIIFMPKDIGDLTVTDIVMAISLLEDKIEELKNAKYENMKNTINGWTKEEFRDIVDKANGGELI